MAIDYDRARNIHTIKGDRAVLPALMEGLQPRNLLDAGCGAGVWMRVALDLGIVEVWGIDGVALPPEQFHMPKDHIVLLNDGFEWLRNREGRCAGRKDGSAVP